MENVKYCNSKKMKKIVFGMLVVLTGLLLLLFNIEAIPDRYKSIIFSWQMLIIAIGIINVAARESRLIGLILIAVGGFFIIPRFDVVSADFVRLFWPALLILVGIMIIFHRGFKSKFRVRESKSGLDEGTIDETNIFGGSKQRLDKQEFKGGQVTNIFGGTELDLSQVSLSEGENVLEINCIFGGVTMVVPGDWKVVIRVTSILGGFTDKRTHLQTDTQTDKVLIITGAVIFGGGELKSF